MEVFKKVVFVFMIVLYSFLPVQSQIELRFCKNYYLFKKRSREMTFRLQIENLSYNTYEISDFYEASFCSTPDFFIDTYAKYIYEGGNFNAVFIKNQKKQTKKDCNFFQDILFNTIEPLRQEKEIKIKKLKPYSSKKIILKLPITKVITTGEYSFYIEYFGIQNYKKMIISDTVRVIIR